MNELKQVWSNGGGTQSIATAVLILQGRLPKPDIGVIVDTHYETAPVWDYFENIVRPAMLLVGLDMARISARDYNPKRATLFYEYADKERESDLEIPAYSTRFGTVGKLKNFCTGRWKVETRDNWLRKAHGLTRSKFVNWIGFSRDEVGRAVRMMKGAEYQKGLIRFPLIHDTPMTRRMAVSVVEDYGWPTPPRSACYICPNHNDNEWRMMKLERPDEFELACGVEREIQLKDPDAWLHRSCVPLGEVDFTQPKDLFASACDSGVCFV